MPFVACASIVLSSYLAFFYWNIKVAVDAQEVVFMRGKKPYLRFKFSENGFSSSQYTLTSGVVKSTDRLLYVFSHNAERGKNYKLHNFSRNTFEECMAHIRKINFKQILEQEVLVLEDEEDEIGKVMPVEEWFEQSIDALGTAPLQFTVNSQAYIKKMKARLRGIAIPMVIAIVLLMFGVLVVPALTQNQHAMDHFMISLSYILALTGIFTILCVVLGWVPYKKARDNTPEKITVYDDRIVFDGKSFKFCNINQIKMTIPNVVGGKIVGRTITITENNLPKTYVLGDGTDNLPARPRRKENVKIFENYDRLFYLLEDIFAVRAAKGNGVSLFVPMS